MVNDTQIVQQSNRRNGNQSRTTHIWLGHHNRDLNPRVERCTVGLFSQRVPQPPVVLEMKDELCGNVYFNSVRTIIDTMTIFKYCLRVQLLPSIGVTSNVPSSSRLVWVGQTAVVFKLYSALLSPQTKIYNDPILRTCPLRKEHRYVHQSLVILYCTSTF